MGMQVRWHLRCNACPLKGEGGGRPSWRLIAPRRAGVVLDGGSRMASNVAGASGGALYALYGSIRGLRLLNGSVMAYNRANSTGASAADSGGGGCGGAAAVGVSGDISGLEVSSGSSVDDNWSDASGGALCTLAGKLQVRILHIPKDPCGHWAVSASSLKQSGCW